jgi:hypothetical protein
MKVISVLVAFVVTVAICACDRGRAPVKEDVDPSAPKTSFGQAVNSAKKLSKESDERNEELERQAKELVAE